MSNAGSLAKTLDRIDLPQAATQRFSVSTDRIIPLRVKKIHGRVADMVMPARVSPMIIQNQQQQQQQHAEGLDLLCCGRGGKGW